MSPRDFIRHLRQAPLADIGAWFTQHAGLGEILDRKTDSAEARIFISDHEDQLQRVERGYGRAKKPQDYLQEFSTFIRQRSNTLPALDSTSRRAR